MTIGVSSLIEGEWLPILAHLLGGAIGTYAGIKMQINKEIL
jgi:hypothetical protein